MLELKALLLTQGMHGMVSQTEGLAKALKLNFKHQKIKLKPLWNLIPPKFTPISEKYQKNPQGLTSLINRFLDNQTEIILKHGGTIDKYMGDCIMAFWGAPLPDENHIENATKAAIDMRIALEELNETLREEGLDEINTGAGINSGPCVVGNFGSTTRFDYSVLGDAVNLAARLESSCKDYDADLIISEHSLVDGYEYEFLDEVTVKGKSEPVKIYTIRK